MKKRKKICCSPRSGDYKNALHGFLFFLLNSFAHTHLNLPAQWKCIKLYLPVPREGNSTEIWTQNMQRFLGKKSGHYRKVQKMLCKGKDGWQSTNQSGIFSAASQSLHPIRHQAEICPALSGTQRAPAAAQEAPGMCFSLINLSDSSVGLAVMQSGNLYIWQSPLVPAVWPRQAACNNTGYLFSCASPLDPGEKRYVLPL